MDNAAKAVKAAIENGIDLIREGAGIDVTSITFITQICATIILFLFVRFFLWDKVTNILEKRKEVANASIKEKEEATKQLEELKTEMASTQKDAERKLKAYEKEMQEKANQEKEAIIAQANLEKEAIIQEAKKAMADEKAQMAQDIKDEIIDVAYLLAEKITDAEVDTKKNQELVEKFFEEHEQ